MYKLGWFSTGRGPGSRALLTSVYDAIKSGDIKAEIEFVFCSRELGEADGSDQFISLVKSYDIPLVTFSYQKFRKDFGSSGALKEKTFPEWRLNYEREIMKRLVRYQPDLCVLAGYMLVVGTGDVPEIRHAESAPRPPRRSQGHLAGGHVAAY